MAASHPMGQTTAATRATKKFPLAGASLEEKCTKCGGAFGDHDGQRCPTAAGQATVDGAVITAPPLSEWYESRETDGDVHPACGREALEHFVWDEAKKKNVIRCPAPVAKPPFPSPLPVPTSAPARFEMIASLRIEESDFNPRKSFDPKKQLEINASVAAKGVLEPILVRPRSANGNDYFEVVAGARRLRAAFAAKLEAVPCLVREMSDTEALECAILENVCREDISAMDEGDAYRALVKLGHTVEAIVEKTGRSRTVVFQRLKLAELEGPIRARLEKGKLSVSVAELLARLPTHSMREAALAALAEKAHWRNKDMDDAENLSAIPFRDAKEILDAECRLVLREAAFDTKSADLVASAGACGVCPKRTGAAKELFPGIKEDHCLDAACWKLKTSAATRLLKEEVREHGKELVKINRLTSQYGSDLAAPVAEKFSRPTEKVDGKSTWKELLGADVPQVVALDKDNKTHNLVDKKKALELLRAKDPKAAEKVEKAAAAPKQDDWQAKRDADMKKRNASNAAARVVRIKALGAVTKLEAAVELLISSLASTEWDWKHNLALAGLPASTKLDNLKPAQKVRLLVGFAFEGQADGVLARAAKLTKLDVKKLTKQALDAEPGTCFACGCTKDKQCRKDGVFCVDGWVDTPQATLCLACGGKED